MKTAKELELLLIIKEHEKQKLQLRLNYAIDYIKELGNCTYLDECIIIKNVNFIKNLLIILEGEDDEIRN